MSPVVLVRKKDESLWLCVAFRALNKVILRDPYPLTVITTCLDKMAGSKYFTSQTSEKFEIWKCKHLNIWGH